MAYFFDSIIGQSTLGDDKRPTRIVWENVGYSLLTWFFVYLCVAFGIKATGRITYVTMGLPIVMLFVFLGRAVSLEGSENGIDQYIRQPDWSVLSNKPGELVAIILFAIPTDFLAKKLTYPMRGMHIRHKIRQRFGRRQSLKFSFPSASLSAL